MLHKLTELRQKVFQRLKDNVTVPVYDGIVPKTGKFPCVRYFFPALREWPSFISSSGFVISGFTVDILSKAAVQTEAEDILPGVLNALDRWKVELTEEFALFGLTGTARRYDEDNEMWVITAEFSVHLVAKS